MGFLPAQLDMKKNGKFFAPREAGSILHHWSYRFRASKRKGFPGNVKRGAEAPLGVGVSW
ncbi:hypothetical protein CQS04_06885 [Chryseomicrobium excrementi]|uniref:Uncharacterized protein n=1 Tax=Chryseomicrobium excrementi TaxID=2041346 RepID=A0A2M9F090_9BACL|nr:hypothetical protein CQS04_06885 [Chryseomicrobium excrementi]